jgi:hypothetical protein
MHPVSGDVANELPNRRRFTTAMHAQNRVASLPSVSTSYYSRCCVRRDPLLRDGIESTMLWTSFERQAVERPSLGARGTGRSLIRGANLAR